MLESVVSIARIFVLVNAVLWLSRSSGRAALWEVAPYTLPGATEVGEAPAVGEFVPGRPDKGPAEGGEPAEGAPAAAEGSLAPPLLETS